MRPVKTGDTSFATVDWFGIWGGDVRHRVDPSRRTIINRTELDHTFHNGAVQRTLLFTDQGVFVYTHGRGNNNDWVGVYDDINETPGFVHSAWEQLNEDVARTYRDLARI